MALLLIGCARLEGTTPDASDFSTLVGPSQVPADSQFVDTRPAADWQRGHLPGAIHVEWGAWTGWDYGGVAEAGAGLAAAGLRPDMPTVVYGDGRDDSDGYVAWGLRHLGMSDVRVLDGGIVGWLLAEGLLDAAVPSPAEFRPEVDDRVLADGLGTVIDVRTAEEFEAGHVEGAIHIDTSAWRDADAYAISADQVRADLADFPLDEELTVYCDTGVRAGMAWVMIVGVGYTDVRLDPDPTASSQ